MRNYGYDISSLAVFFLDLLFSAWHVLCCEKLWTGDSETNCGNEPWANNCVLRRRVPVVMHCIVGDEGKDNIENALFTCGCTTAAFWHDS